MDKLQSVVDYLKLSQSQQKEEKSTCPSDVEMIKKSVKMYECRMYDSYAVPTICYG